MQNRKKYLLQIDSCITGVHIGYVQKANLLAKQGLNTISDIKHGEFNLHTKIIISTH